tara:strand:- start:1055 stop:1390 length:336 start_codon:yes stop_codon:yes gene_type:complete
MTKKKEKHSEHYYKVGRNGWVATTTSDKMNEIANNIKDVVDEVLQDSRIPEYYIGKYHKYEARKVIEDFELTYNIGTAVTYLLRANRKHNTPVECIKKAIAHLEFELEKIK